jgi:hypothetical protein
MAITERIVHIPSTVTAYWRRWGYTLAAIKKDKTEVIIRKIMKAMMLRTPPVLNSPIPKLPLNSMM